MKRIFLVLVAACLAPATALAGDAKPNILFLLADDLGWQDLGCYRTAAGGLYETPHIDRLAASGLKFTQAYSAGAVCSPTRSSIMTGEFPVRTGITDYIPGLHPAGVRLATPYTKTALALEEVTIGEALREHGYQTFYSGKWHLGGSDASPQQQGFEVVVDDAGLGNPGKDPLVGDRLTESALRFLDTRDAARPFFMFLGFHEPHTPILPHPRHIERFQARAAQLPEAKSEPIKEHDGLSRTGQNDPAYATELAVLDEAVQRLEDKLQQRGLADSTVVIFFSDNGGLCTLARPGTTCNLPLRSGKGWLYEGGIRVPLIVRVPGITQPGTACDVPVISTDFYATLLELAGVPARPQQHVDGLSLVPLLRGGQSLPRQALYWHYPHYHGSTWAPGAAIRHGDWKLIEFYHYETVELYNLESDLGEQRNLAQQEPERVRQLLDALHAWQNETQAVIPTRADPSASERPVGPKSKRRAKQDKN